MIKLFERELGVVWIEREVLIQWKERISQKIENIKECMASEKEWVVQLDAMSWKEEEQKVEKFYAHKGNI